MVTQYGTPRTQMQEGGLTPRPVSRGQSIFGPALQVAAQQAQQNFEKAQAIKLSKQSSASIGRAYEIRATLNNKRATGEIADFETYQQQANEQFSRLEDTLPPMARENPELVSRLRGIFSATINEASEVFVQQEIRDFNIEQGRLIENLSGFAQSAITSDADALDYIGYGEDAIRSLQGKSDEEKDLIAEKFRDDAIIGRIENLFASGNYTSEDIQERLGNYGLSGQGLVRAEQLIQKQIDIEEREFKEESSRIFYRQAWRGELNIEALEKSDAVTGSQENSLKALNLDRQMMILEQQQRQAKLDAIRSGDWVPDPLDRDANALVQEHYRNTIDSEQIQEDPEGVIARVGNDIRTLQVMPEVLVSPLRSTIANRNSSVQDIARSIELWDMMASQSEEAASKVDDDWIKYAKVGRSLLGSMTSEEAALKVKNYRDRFNADEKGRLETIAKSPDATKVINEVLDTENINDPRMRYDLSRYLKDLIRLGVIDTATGGEGNFLDGLSNPFSSFSASSEDVNPSQALETALKTTLTNTQNSPKGWSVSNANPYRIPQWTKMAPEKVVPGVTDGALAQAVFEESLIESGITTPEAIYPAPGDKTITSTGSLRPPITSPTVRDVSQGRGVFRRNEETGDTYRIEPDQDTANSKRWTVYRTDRLGNTTMLLNPETQDPVYFIWDEDAQAKYDRMFKRKHDVLQKEAVDRDSAIIDTIQSAAQNIDQGAESLLR